MAHVIVAVDLGGSSIKLARFEAGFRRFTLLDTRTFAATHAGKPIERIPEQLRALAAYLAAEKLVAEELVLGLPGDALSFRIADLPFDNPRQIESVLSYELESQILAPVEELVLDFVIVGPARALGEGPAETRVLVAAAPKALIDVVVRTAAELSLPLRTVAAAPLGYAALLGDRPAAVPAEGEEAAPEARAVTSMLLDFGAEQTGVCVVRRERPLLCRTIARGSDRITESIAAAFSLDPVAAEAAKVDAGFVAHRGSPRLTPSQTHMDGAVRAALAPLIRELRQTLASFRATYGEGVDRLVVTGGGGRLPGLCEHLGEELGVEAAPLLLREREGITAAAVEGRDELACAVGLGLGVQLPGTQVNFRKGEFAYRSDFSFLRAKALHLSVAAALIVLFTGLYGWVSYRGLRKEHDVLATRLKTATKEVFGKERDDLSRISDELKEGPKASAQVPIPSLSAFDILEEMSRVVPPSDKIRLDFEDLDIRPKKMSIKGTTETAQQVDDLTEALKKIDCIEEVQKGKLVKRAAPPPPVTTDQVGILRESPKEGDKPAGPTELTQFTLTIKSSCP